MKLANQDQVAALDPEFAEFETLVAIDRRVAVLDHEQEQIGLREDLADGRRGVGIGRRRVVAGQRLLLRTDHALGGGDVVRGKRRTGGRTQPDQDSNKQNEGAHGDDPRLIVLVTEPSGES